MFMGLLVRMVNAMVVASSSPVRGTGTWQHTLGARKLLVEEAQQEKEEEEATGKEKEEEQRKKEEAIKEEKVDLETSIDEEVRYPDPKA